METEAWRAGQPRGHPQVHPQGVPLRGKKAGGHFSGRRTWAPTMGALTGECGRMGEVRSQRVVKVVLRTHSLRRGVLGGGVAGAEPPHKGGPNRPDRPTAVVSDQWSVISGQLSVDGCQGAGGWMRRVGILGEVILRRLIRWGTSCARGRAFLRRGLRSRRDGRR